MKIEIGTIVYWNSPTPSPASHGGTYTDFGHVIEISQAAHPAYPAEWKVRWNLGHDTWEDEEDIKKYRQNFLDVEASLK